MSSQQYRTEEYVKNKQETIEMCGNLIIIKLHLIQD